MADFGLEVDLNCPLSFVRHFVRSITFIFLILNAVQRLPAQGFLWVRTSGGASDDSASACVRDSSGNIYTSGFFDGTLSIGNTNLMSYGGRDIFLAKHDSAGNFLWVRQAGGTNSDEGRGLSFSTSGYIFLTGSFEGTAAFGSTNVTATGSGPYAGRPTANVFVAKYDLQGNLIWVSTSAGTGGGAGVAIASDAAGNNCVAGYHKTWGQECRILVAKRNSNGDVLWSKEVVAAAGTSFQNQASAIAVNSSGEIFVAGQWVYGMNIDGQVLNSSGWTDIFLEKLNSGGGLQWVQQIGGTDFDYATGLQLDSNGNPHLSGEFRKTASFGTTNLTTYFPTSGNPEGFLATYQSNGDLLWATALGVNISSCTAIAVDKNNNSYVTGYINPPYLFVSKYDSAGTFISRITGGYGAGNAISVDDNGHAFFAGGFTGGPFDTVAVTNRGGYDIFVARASDQMPPVITTQPQNRSVRAGESATFSATLRSFAPASFQWFFNGEPVADATNSQISLVNLSTRQNGLYFLQASNIYGVTLSSNAALLVQPNQITGQWDFDNSDLSATVGLPLEFLGDTATYTFFTNVSINGELARGMYFPACKRAQGYRMKHGAVPERGGTMVNEWSLIMDICWLNPTNNAFSGFIQINTPVDNISNADLLAKWTNGMGAIGVLGQYPTNRVLLSNAWHRVAFGINMRSNGLISKYIDGVKVADQNTGQSTNGLHALFSTALLFSDGNSNTLSGCVNSVQIRNYKISDQEIAALGGASAEGIPVYRLDSKMQSDHSLLLSVARRDGIEISEMPASYGVYGTTNLSLPIAQWELLTNIVSSNGIISFRENTESSVRFYRFTRQF